MDHILRDFQFTLRSLRKDAGWGVAVLLTLTLGIGASTAILSVVDAVLLRPLDYAEPDRLVVLHERNVERGGELAAVGPPTFFGWRRLSASFAGLAAYSGVGVATLGGDLADRVPYQSVSPGFFGVLGVQAARGRTFLPEEETPGHDVAVVSHGFWQSRLGGTADLGQEVRLDGTTYRVVGVLPEGFRFYGGGADVYLPLSFPPEARSEGMYGARYLALLGRLRPDVSLASARAELNALHDRLGAEHPNLAQWDADVRRWQDSLVAETRPALLLLLGVAGFVLLIACASVSGLLLARTVRRQREMALRGALGASARRLLGQVLTESVVLSLLAGGLGLLAATWALDVLVGQIPWRVPRLDEVAVNHRVLVLTVAISVVCGLLAGMVPAWNGTRLRLAGVLGEGTADLPGRRSGRLFSTLVVVELALALVVLVGAGLLVRSFVLLRGVDPGFDAEGVRVAFVSLARSRFPEPTDRRRVAGEVLAAVEAAGARAALDTNLPFNGSRMNFGFALPDVGEDAGGAERTAQYHTVGGSYFEVLGIPLRSGRVFDGRDDADAAPVAVVNQVMAERFWPGRDPLGQRLTMFGDHVERSVVGVVGNVRHFGRSEEQPAQVYVPFAQDPWQFFHLVTRPGAAGPEALPDALRGAVRSAGLPLDGVAAMSDLVTGDLAPRRFQMLLIALFGVVALVLAMSGLYGVVAYSSSQRTHEVAVRLALGADRRQILWQFLGQGLGLVALGLLVGTLGALAASRLLEGFLYGVKPWDPVTFGAIASILVAVSLAATLRPARRATLRDPMASLRTE